MNNIKDFIVSNFKEYLFKAVENYTISIKYFDICSVIVYKYEESRLILYITALADRQKKLYLNCEFDIENYIFEIKSVSSFKSDIKAKMTDRLIPIMDKDSFDNEAESFLTKYYPEALKKSVPVDIDLLSERMNLNIICSLLPDGILGQTFFKKTENYDKGTVLVNNTGNINFTVVHECVHWENHRFYFRLFSDGYAQCTSENREVIETDIDWMEWQANQITPRILMPKATVIPKIEEMFETYRCMKDERQKYRKIICELSLLYKVSKKTAKIRMIELGYKQAEGILNFVDGKYLPDYWFGEGSLKQGETFDIGLSDAVEMYKNDEDFRNLLRQGWFIYDDCHFCLNTPKYVTKNGKMTDYAKLHMDECCLVFNIKRCRNGQYNHFKYNVLFRDANVSKLIKLCKNELPQNATVTEQAEYIKHQGDLCANIIQELPGTFNATLVKLMDMYDITVDKLAEESLLQPRTIQLYRNDVMCRPKFKSVVAICIGMHLHPLISSELIKRTSVQPIGGSNEDAIYNCILTIHWKKSIYEVNEFLEIMKVALLSV